MKACLCTRCSMRYALQETGIYPLCYICFLKSKRFYRSAIENIATTDWWNCKTKWNFRVGWSFAETLNWILLFANILNHPGLNKSCKVPSLTKGLRKDGWPKQLSDQKTLKELDESNWRITVALRYYCNRKAKVGLVKVPNRIKKLYVHALRSVLC
ncbi:hypothetical protein LCGC14_2067540 [marine sediment metagenome]|uniref:Uncharacterized protein n=1 Tax=marine sediment metagenome TaxID=412755 RepID=A0A0F9EJA1_9ZZZZ